jgi:hypothetical protein
LLIDNRTIRSDLTYNHFPARMAFARPAVSAADQDSSSNDMRCICDHGRRCQPQKQNSRQEVARAQNSALTYHDWNKYIRAKWCRPNAGFRVRVGRKRLAVLTAASEKLETRLA